MAVKPRAIFEEAGTTSRPVATPGGIDRGRPEGRRWARVWLVALYVLVVVMILVGGATRLTDSGLSITEWNLVTGVVPPLSEANWTREFEAYRTTPHYELVNRGMTLPEFKSIYWWEWAHRALGRIVGLVWIAGFLALLLARRVPPGWTPRFVLVGALIGVQGAVGWWMVRSGLEEGQVAVASTRLALHLGLAFGLLGLLAWDVLRLSRREPELMAVRRQGEARLFGVATGLMHLLAVQVLLGALVAGIDAGRAFPTWPLMGEGFLPPDPFAHDPWYAAFVADAGLVQFMHRIAGYLVAVLAVVAFARARRSPHPTTRRAFGLILGAVALQVALGIATVLTAVPLALALAHLATAVLLWTLVVRGRFLARHPVAASIRG